MKKTYTNDFKAKIALEALRGDKTIVELSAQYSVHPNQITIWKKQILEGASSLFERHSKKEAIDSIAEKKSEDLYKNIGLLKVENDFLKKKYRQIYGREPDL
jgi:transposase